MASLQRRADSWRVIFRHRGTQHFVTIGEVGETEAEGVKARYEYLLRLIDQRLLALPPGMDIVTFLRHDGKPPKDKPSPAPRDIGFASFRDEYLKTIGNGAVESNTLNTSRIHLAHLKQTLGERYWPQGLDRRPDFLQHLDAYLELFEHFGYERCSEPFAFRPEHADPQPRVEKVALSARREPVPGGSYFQCPHVARQLATGGRSSKAQEHEIFEHSLWALKSELADESNDAGWPPEECLERHPSGRVVGHLRQNYGQVALVMRRDANVGPKGFADQTAYAMAPGRRSPNDLTSTFSVFGPPRQSN